MKPSGHGVPGGFLYSEVVKIMAPLFYEDAAISGRHVIRPRVARCCWNFDLDLTQTSGIFLRPGSLPCSPSAVTGPTDFRLVLPRPVSPPRRSCSMKQPATHRSSHNLLPSFSGQDLRKLPFFTCVSIHYAHNRQKFQWCLIRLSRSRDEL